MERLDKAQAIYEALAERGFHMTMVRSCVCEETIWLDPTLPEWVYGALNKGLGQPDSPKDGVEYGGMCDTCGTGVEDWA